MPHRQFVFTIPKILRGIFRKRRHLLHLLFQTATECLRDAFRIRLDLPGGRIAAAAAVHTFGDYLVFHPHLHVFAADGLFDKDGRFHCMPTREPSGGGSRETDCDEGAALKRSGRVKEPEEATESTFAPLTELFRNHFLQVLLAGRHLSAHKVADLLSWKHSGFHVHADPEPVAPHDIKGRKRLAEYLLRAPFSLQKIHWNPATRTVTYRSRRSWHTKKNYEIFPAADFLAAAIEHIPPKSQQTIRY